MTRNCKPREYDAGKDGNPFLWILEESERQRHHNDRYRDEARAARRPAPAVAPGQSLRGFHKGRVVALDNLQKACTDTAGEYVFEVSKARKL